MRIRVLIKTTSLPRDRPVQNLRLTWGQNQGLLGHKPCLSGKGNRLNRTFDRGVGIELKATLKARKLLILFNAKNAKNS
jgi:hypothetical protein